MTDSTIIDLQRQIDALQRQVEELRTAERPILVARCKKGVAQTITGAGTRVRIDYESVDYDPYGAITTGASWAFTAPWAGYFWVTASLIFAGSTLWTWGNDAALELWRNGARHAVLEYRDYIETNGGAVNVYVNMRGMTMIQMAKGDAAYIQAWQQSANSHDIWNAAAANQYSHVSIACI